MTEADFLFLKSLGADPQPKLFTEQVTLHMEAELELMRFATTGAAPSFPVKLITRRLLAHQSEFANSVKDKLLVLIAAVEKDPAGTEAIAKLSSPKGVIRALAREVFIDRLSALVREMRLTATQSPSTSETKTSGSESDGGEIGISIEYGPEDLSALAREHFTEEDIRGSLEDLQNLKSAAGMELRDFIFELERMVEAP